MAHIAPFRALRYDPARVNLSQAVTQPYDKITPEMQELYYAASPHNLVRIILGKAQTGDHAGENTYTRAAAYFRDWRREGVFLQDAQPSIYSYVQQFAAPGGKELERRGFIALGQLEDYSENVVFRHEQTLAKPKADRLDLLRATRAHFGQIFMLYSDPEGEIDGRLTSIAAPDIDTRDEYGVRHQVSKVSDPALVELVCDKMRDKKLIIADGHHRYETALNYRNERRSTADTAPPWGIRSFSTALPSYEMVMMTFINMDSPALLILPTHRVVHGLATFSADQLRQAAAQYFSVEEVDPSVDAVRASGILREAGRAGTALMAVTRDRVLLIDTPKGVGSDFLSGLSIRQQALDVVQLHKYLLEGVLGISEGAIRNQQHISYQRDAGEAMAQVRTGGANVAFLMNPVRMRQVRDIAFAGEVLPQKSTDFYPKLLSGLTIYALD
ncbi:MAG TPA: DUF1015 domain-containing protein [Terriglobales bacterium]|jgi:uncharacterized protein (DUF1015 family)|nr:DUF1015 domain-containing protein [Terriglobales bacterium]